MAKEPRGIRKLQAALHSRIEEPRLDELIGAIVHAMGGVKGAALFIVEEINKSPSGSALRKGMMDMLLRGLKAIADRSQPGDMTLMTDSDLERETMELIGKMTEGSGDEPEPDEPDTPPEDSDEPEEEAPVLKKQIAKTAFTAVDKEPELNVLD